MERQDHCGRYGPCCSSQSQRLEIPLLGQNPGSLEIFILQSLQNLNLLIINIITISISYCFNFQQVKNELPSTFKAYRYQQHRWSCGPANLFRKMVMEIMRNKVNHKRTFCLKLDSSSVFTHSHMCNVYMSCPVQKVSLWKKIHVIYSFFFVRKVIAHINTFVFYCIVLPATVVVPEVAVPKWGAVYIPSLITLLNAVGTPRSSFSSFFHDHQI